MDTTAYLLINKIQTSGKVDIYDIFLFLCILPIFSLLLPKFSSIYSRIYDMLIKRNVYKTLKMEVIENITTYGESICEYPICMTALSWYIFCKNNQNMKVFDSAKNGRRVGNMHIINNSDTRLDYILDITNGHVPLDEDIKFSVERYNPMQKDQTMAIATVLTLYSSKVKLCAYVDDIVEKYKKYISQKTKGKLYHFIYNGFDDSKSEKLNFITKVWSDIETPNYETFDTVFHEYSNIIISDVKRLRDLSFYKKKGMPRRKGYLFYGEPGTGKSRTIKAIANLDKRHIIEVPMCRVNTNKELEEIMNINSINGISFTYDQVILVFDEIDTASSSALQRKDNESDKAELILKKDVVEKLEKITDTLNIGVFLSRLDGIGNYDGLIIVATTNNKEKLDPALYRDQRLTPLYFTYCRRDDIINMIENYYEICLSSDQKALLPNRQHKLTAAKIRTLIDRNDNHDNLICELERIANNELVDISMIN